MEKVEILTPEQLEKQTDARLDAYLEQVKNYMALDMPSDQLGTYKELVQSIMTERKAGRTGTYRKTIRTAGRARRERKTQPAALI